MEKIISYQTLHLENKQKEKKRTQASLNEFNKRQINSIELSAAANQRKIKYFQTPKAGKVKKKSIQTGATKLLQTSSYNFSFKQTLTSQPKCLSLSAA